MPSFKVDIPPHVEKEVEYYIDIIARDNLTAALNWYREIEVQINTLHQNPKRCPVAFESRFHEYEIRNLIFGNYRILFRIEKKTVQILHVKHGKMERKPLEQDNLKNSE